MKQLTTLKWLLKREIWENKALLIWSNLALAGVILLVTILGVFRWSSIVFANNVPVNLQVETVSAGVAVYFNTGFTIFALMMALTMYSYVSGSLSQERKDRSILFWKSLPISDELTVLSKAIVALILFPLMASVTLILTMLISMFAVYIACAIHGVSLFAALFGNGVLWGRIGTMCLSLPVYVAWALPTVSWIILVSSRFIRRVSLWVALIPIAIYFIFAIFNEISGLKMGTSGLAYVLFTRGLFSIVPNNWMSNFHISPALDAVPNGAVHFGGSTDLPAWSLFASADIWLGVIAGVAMLYAAARVRRSHGE
ncbi:hypothetical protein [Undibacterium sp. RuRC25W]|uniref:hypothetical protein n=1 Tax=Undibacterium sp. RuRC25W TaxID=3413047 RepID=UPI003BF41DC7